MGAAEAAHESTAQQKHANRKMAEVMSTTQMFVGNLPWSVRTKHLEDDFGKFGEVTDAFVAYKGRRSRGFGFVTMKNPEDATRAQAALGGKQVGEGDHEREMRVTFAKQRSPEDQAKADAAKEAATHRRAERQRKKEAAAEEGAEAPAEEKPKPKGRKRAPKKKGGGGGGAHKEPETVPEEVALNVERVDQSAAEIKAASKGGFAAPKAPPRAAA